MIQEVLDEILSDSPRYSFRDENGNLTNDDVDIILKTPIVQQGTPLNSAFFKNLQGDLYSEDRYNENIPYFVETDEADLFNLQDTNIVNTGTLKGMAANNNVCVVAGGSTTKGYFVTTDAQTWQQITHDHEDIADMISFGESTFFAVSSRTRKIYRSIDNGQTWTSSYDNSASGYFVSITQGDGKIVAAGLNADNETFVATSINGGSSWNIKNLNTGTATNKIFYDGKFRLVNEDKQLITSTNGTNWVVEATISIAPSCITKHPTESIYFAIANNTEIYTSTNFQAWTLCTTLGFQATSIIHTGTELVVSGYSGYVALLNPNTGALKREEAKMAYGASQKIIYWKNKYFVTSGSHLYFSLYKTFYELKINLPLTSYEQGKEVKIVGSKIPNPLGETISYGNIIPQSWEREIVGTKYVASDGSGKILTADSYSSANTYADNACDGQSATVWESEYTAKIHWIKIKFPEMVKITKMKTLCKYAVNAPDYIKVQGCNNDSSWIDLYTFDGEQTELEEITLQNPNFFTYYRIAYYFTNNGGGGYVAEWQTTEYIQPLSDYVTSFENAYLNINNLGIKKINSSINYNENYVLVYNGESWDIVNNRFVTGSFASSGSLQTITVGFTPKIVIAYATYNNYRNIADYNGSIDADYNYIPRILTKAYTSADGALTEGGFTFNGSGTNTVYYIAIG